MVQKRTISPDWDDLRLVLAVARSGSLRKAAISLGLGHATLSRRLGQLEKQLNVRLFDRPASGAVELTAAGEELAASAGQMDEVAAAVVLKVAGRDLSLSGTLRVSVTPLLGTYVLAPAITAFAAAYPDLAIEVSSTYASADLDRREADVVIRATEQPPETLVGQRFCRAAFGLYAARSAVEVAGSEAAYLASSPPVLGYVGRPDNLWDEAWFTQKLPGLRHTLTTNDPVQLMALARSGGGIARLACCAADADHDLVRIVASHTEYAYDIWLLTHMDLRKTARVRAFMDHMSAALKELAPVIGGETKAA